MKKLLLLLGVLGMFVAMPVLAADFKDVPSTNANYTAIITLRDKGVIGGYPDGTFKPDQTVNRVEALKIILNAAKIDSAGAKVKASFTDTSSTQWYAPFLNKAVESKIVVGYPDGTFKPEQTVNLAENLKMLLNTFKVNMDSVNLYKDPYTDVAKDQWYAAFAQYAKDKKLLEADSFGRINPSQGMTRGKLAELAYRVMVVEENHLDYFGQTIVRAPDAPLPSDDSLSTPNAPQGRDDTLQVNITGSGFSVPEMTIGKATAVRFTNTDSMSHDVTSDNGKFASGTLAAGASWTYTFNSFGTFAYHCSIHPSMKAKIIVTDPLLVPTI